MGVAVEQNKGADPLGMGDSEVDRRWSEYSDSYHRGSLETHSVDHGGEVGVHDLSRSGIPGVTLGCACAPSVKPEGPAESVQPPADPDVAGIFRQEIHRDRTGTAEHQVERSIAAHLVGEVGAVG
jgi:hypothetical protein